MSDGSEFQVCGPKKTDVRTQFAFLECSSEDELEQLTLLSVSALQTQSSCCY